MKEPIPETWTIHGVLLGVPGQAVRDRPFRRYRLSNVDGISRCVIPSDQLANQWLSRPLTTCQFTMASTSLCDDDHPFGVPMVCDITRCEINEPLLELAPDLCPIDGVLGRIIGLIHAIQSTPLSLMVERIFTNREVCAYFWTMPASARHHHAYPGGLALHCLQVAEDLAGQTVLAPHERDLAIAGALLHDIGKVWGYSAHMVPNQANRAMGHAVIALSRLEKELKLLEAEWSDGAYAMRVLLAGSGRMRDDGSMPTALLARLRAADQRSCEMDRSRASGSVWVPLPVENSGLDAVLGRW